MSIIITADNTLRVRFWMNAYENKACEMPLNKWSTNSRDLLNDCWDIAKTYNILDEQAFLPFQ